MQPNVKTHPLAPCQSKYRIHQAAAGCNIIMSTIFTCATWHLDVVLYADIVHCYQGHISLVSYSQ